MFNDLNQPNQPAAPTPPVDDIFAETDKTTEAKNFSGYAANSTNPASVNSLADIEIQKAGLSTTEDFPVSSKGKILKVGLIALLIILLIGLGYLVYIKFLAGQGTSENIISPTDTAPIVVQAPIVTEPATVTIPVSEEITVVTSTPLASVTPPVNNLADTDGDRLTDEEETILGTDIDLVDTDGDGLTDYDEVKIYNTNAKLVDIDGDGLSDYEEIKIYKTDPNKKDTDGDGYSDGEEVKSGYNPLGDGKLIDAQATTSITVIK